MAILDASLEFSDGQSQVASSAAVTQSTNVRNLWDSRSAAPNKDAWGTAEGVDLSGLTWNVNVKVVINATTVITAKLMAHTGASSIKSGTEIAQIVLPAAAPAGTRRSMMLPVGTKLGTTLDYIGVTYTVSGAQCTTGSINSWLGLDSESPG